MSHDRKKPVDTQELRALLAAASRGEWYLESEMGAPWNIAARDEPVEDVGQTFQLVGDPISEMQPRRTANARLIVALHNAAAALLDEVDRLRKLQPVRAAEPTEIDRSRLRTVTFLLYSSNNEDGYGWSFIVRDTCRAPQEMLLELPSPTIGHRAQRIYLQDGDDMWLLKDRYDSGTAPRRLTIRP